MRVRLGKGWFVLLATLFLVQVYTMHAHAEVDARCSEALEALSGGCSELRLADRVLLAGRAASACFEPGARHVARAEISRWMDRCALRSELGTIDTPMRAALETLVTPWSCEMSRELVDLHERLLDWQERTLELEGSASALDADLAVLHLLAFQELLATSNTCGDEGFQALMGRYLSAREELREAGPSGPWTEEELGLWALLLSDVARLGSLQLAGAWQHVRAASAREDHGAALEALQAVLPALLRAGREYAAAADALVDLMYLQLLQREQGVSVRTAEEAHEHWEVTAVPENVATAWRDMLSRQCFAVLDARGGERAFVEALEGYLHAVENGMPVPATFLQPQDSYFRHWAEEVVGLDALLECGLEVMQRRSDTVWDSTAALLRLARIASAQPPLASVILPVVEVPLMENLEQLDHPETERVRLWLSQRPLPPFPDWAALPDALLEAVLRYPYSGAERAELARAQTDLDVRIRLREAFGAPTADEEHLLGLGSAALSREDAALAAALGHALAHAPVSTAPYRSELIALEARLLRPPPADHETREFMPGVHVLGAHFGFGLVASRGVAWHGGGHWRVVFPRVPWLRPGARLEGALDRERFIVSDPAGPRYEAVRDQGALMVVPEVSTAWALSDRWAAGLVTGVGVGVGFTSWPDEVEETLPPQRVVGLVRGQVGMSAHWMATPRWEVFGRALVSQELVSRDRGAHWGLVVGWSGRRGTYAMQRVSERSEE